MISDYKKYERIELLGKGGQGIVYKVQNRENNEYYALKTIFNDNEIIDKVEKLIAIKNDNIVDYFGYFIQDDLINIIMEYCENSDLNKFITDHKNKGTKINQKIILIISLDICKGIMEIHKNNLIHRDLKPENIFINRNYQIKIGDFGILKQLSDHTKVAYSQIGTDLYYAPERFENEYYDNKIDIWSLGCIIYELCALKKCFNSRMDIINKIKSKIKFYGKIDSNYYNKDLQNIIYKLLEPNPKKRPNIEEVYNLINDCNANINLDDNIINSLDKTSFNILNSHINKTNNKDKCSLPRENEKEIEDHQDNEIENIFNKENFLNLEIEESLIDKNKNNYNKNNFLKLFKKKFLIIIISIILIVGLIIGLIINKNGSDIVVETPIFYPNNKTNKTITDYYGCIYPPNGCPEESPFRCLVNGTKEVCVKTRIDCDCPNGYYKCPYMKYCVPDDRTDMCPTYKKIQCSKINISWTQFEDGICRSKNSTKPSQIVCPLYYVLCPDLTCRENYDKCLKYENLTRGNIRCVDQEIVSLNNVCSSTITCTNPNQYVCNGECVDSELHCKPLTNCSANYPYLCANNVCAENETLCYRGIACGDGHSLCENNTCQKNCR